MTTVAERRAELERRKEYLGRRLGAIEAELESHEARDWEDMATEREADEVLEGIGVAGQQELRRIEAALQRIEAGEYGFCTKCGAEISEGRLDLLPETPFCAACAP
ncbi:MAG: TraR/DksA family transcriptional regulator [Gemmobacter sp.]